MDNDIVLEVKNITKQFPGTLALNDVSLDVRKGEALAVIGENGAGKSTLMNIISGVFPADEGSIYLNGEELVLNNARDALEHGIGFVHQELSLCSHLSVAENLFMSSLSNKAFVNFKEINRQSAELLSKFKATFPPTTIVGSLNVAQQQIVEITKALTRDTKVMIFDEPTASLSEREIIELFEIIKELKSNGIAILYISHRLDEVFRVCDRVTILKDGCYVNTYEVKDIDSNILIKGMVGRDIEHLYPPKSSSISEIIFEVKNFTSEKRFEDVSFNLRKGEILGFYGLVGAGRTELMRSICGIDPRMSGEVSLDGKKLNNETFIDAIDNGIVYITENRKEEGLFLEMTIQRNLSVVILKKILKGLFLNDAKEQEIGNKYVNELQAKVQGLGYRASTLSGGNQQKIVIGKWLAATPRLIIMDEPTRGIDVGSKVEIHKMLRDMAEAGLGVIIVSSELPEIIGLSDRVVVMCEGKVRGEVSFDEMTEENIVSLASQRSQNTEEDYGKN